MADQTRTYRRLMRESVSRLGAPARRQVAYLRRLGVHPSVDELALEFHELALLAGGRTEQGDLTGAEAELVARLDAKLDAMSGAEHASLWTPDALSSAPEWDEVRELADECLKALRTGATSPRDGRFENMAPDKAL